MKKTSHRREILVIMLIASLLITPILGGCGGGSGDKAADQPKQQMLVHTSGQIGGGQYPLSVLFNDIWMEKIPELNLSVIEGGLIANNRIVSEGIDAQFGWAYTCDFLDALKGQGSYEKDGPQKGVLAMAYLYPCWFQVGVLDAKKDIKTIGDLKGKRVFTGAPGTAAENMFKRVLEAYGMSYESIKASGGSVSFGNYSDGVTQLKDGVVDAVAAIGGPEVTAFKEADLTNPIRILPFEADKLKYLTETKDYGYKVIDIPANTYKTVTSPIPVLDPQTIFIFNKDLDQELVYKMTKVFWENVNRMKQEQPSRAGWFDVKKAMQGLTVEQIHPGALKYYQEVGVYKP